MQRSINSLESLFQQALELSPDDQRSFLEALRRDDCAMANRLESMLRGIDRADSFFARNPIALASDGELTLAPVSNEFLGRRIGRYQIIEEIGEGGCGVVYLAGQTEPVRRRVAMKVIKAGMDSKNVIARFGAERQVLALMDHPNIAKVLDAGSTETGRPYFVMELVEGVKITEYCATNQLSIPARLHLFLRVCEAVQHAHQKGIIHRDLKPSNIIVSAPDRNFQPVPKIIDFGIAKAIEGKLTEATLHTGLHQFIGTPAYMSPEQAQMSPDIDTRTDIYSLGVLLYELLTGKPPFDNHELLTAGLDEMRRIIREVEPKLPSQLALTTGHLSLSTDLDWIVMKCLEKDRNRRYDTANGLAADIQRHLINEPVTARPPSAAYRFQKAFRRNRVQFIAAGISTVALILGLVASSWQAVKAKRAEKIAKNEAEAARTVKDFITQELLGRLNPFVGPDFNPNKRVLLEGIAQAIEGKFQNQPAIEAAVRHAVGDAFSEFQDPAQSGRQLEKAFQIRTNLFGLDHPDSLLTATHLAQAYNGVARKHDAEQLVIDAIAAARRSKRLSRGMGEALYERGWLLLMDGTNLQDTRRSAEALTNLNESIEVLRRTVNENDLIITEVMWSVALANWVLGSTNAGALWEEPPERTLAWPRASPDRLLHASAGEAV